MTLFTEGSDVVRRLSNPSMLMLCSGMDENVLGSSAELFFAPIDASFADDAPLLHSGFRIIPLDYGKGVFCWMLREIGNCNLPLDMLYNKLQLTFGFDSSLMWML